MLRPFLIVWLLSLMLPLSTLAGQVSVKYRDTGYTMGDLIETKVIIQLGRGQRIDKTSLPQPGRMMPWLELRSVTISDHLFDSRQEINLVWQIFATVEHALPLKLPGIEVGIIDNRPTKLLIPPQTIHLSPVLPNPLTSEQPRADLPPYRFDEKSPLLKAFLCLGLALVSVTIWCWLTDRLPFLPRHPGPITNLARKLKHIQKTDITALKTIHAALNNAAGETLYPETLGRLFELAPYLKPEQRSIEQFFLSSWQHFYGEGHALPDIAAIKEWIQRAAIAERLWH